MVPQNHRTRRASGGIQTKKGGCAVAGFFDTILSGLEKGNAVQIGYGNTEENYSIVTGTVEANAPQDGILMIRKEDGKPAVIRYRVVQDINVLEEPIIPQNRIVPVTVPVEKGYADREMTASALGIGDGELKALFDGLPKNDKSRLVSAYDRFCHGLRINDKSRLRSAAEQARDILFQEDDRNYDWSFAAAELCGQMLCRAGIYDPEVFLMAEKFWEAAVCACRQNAWSDAGVYAAVALMEGEKSHQEDLLTILARATVECDDSTAVCAWLRKAGDTPEAGQMKSQLLARKGEDRNQNADRLKVLYPRSDMQEELEVWKPREEPVKTAPAAPAPVKELPLPLHYGRIRFLQWTAKTGIVADDDGNEYTFAYGDLEEKGLKQVIENCCDSRLNGSVHWVRFRVQNGRAVELRTAESALRRGSKIAQDAGYPDRYARAAKLCKTCLDTPDATEALQDLAQYALEQFKKDTDRKALEENARILREHPEHQKTNAKSLSAIAQICRLLEDLDGALEYTDLALECPGLPVKMEMTVLAQFARYGEEKLEKDPDRKLARRVLKATDRWLDHYRQKNLETDATCVKALSKVIVHRVAAQCVLEQPDQAEKTLAGVDRSSLRRADLDQAEELIRQARKKEKKNRREETPPAAEAAETALIPEQLPGNPDAEQEELREEEDLPVEPYADREGWQALGMEPGQVVRYALSIRGSAQISNALAYLKAGSLLCPDIGPVYRMTALAADDPMEDPEYTPGMVMDLLSAPDGGCGALKELCMASILLRQSFSMADGRDNGEDALRAGIPVIGDIPGLEEILDQLNRFRRMAGRGAERYAAFRNREEQLRSMEDLRRAAGDLYERCVAAPPRLDAKMARWIETRKILFARDSLLGVLLDQLRREDRDGLARQKEAFAAECMIRPEEFGCRRLTAKAVEGVITRAWDEAGKRMTVRKNTANPQGNLGNNLRSTVTEVMDTIFRWYALDAQRDNDCADETVTAAFEALRAAMPAKLRELAQTCAREAESAGDHTNLGWRVLEHTARELADKLEGTWDPRERTFFYGDFLRSGEILLDDRFLPELDDSFCALEEFNVLARLRRHMEGEKLTLQAHLDRIFGREKQWNNYGTAGQILAWAESGLSGETAQVPAHPELYRAQTEKQAKMHLRIFLENYAMAASCGQIDRGNAFCAELENTVRFWFGRWAVSGNYGRAMRLMELAQQQIRRSARRYEQMLSAQLDAMTLATPELFRSHPEHIEAIREQISLQNFLVAEDWMNQARQGRLHIRQETREALGYLEQFWKEFPSIYNQVADTSRPLKSLVGSRLVRNKDTKGAQMLIDNWLGNGGPTPLAKINGLLKLLGWRGMKAEIFRYAGDPAAELFRIIREGAELGRENPLHPIADFGSRANREGMYALCLYGSYDAQRLYAKIQAVDALDGSKVIFLDHALGSTDRRLLARKLKQREAGLANTCLVIDRVMLMYLANHYNENLIARILMAVGMPFAWCQPYVADSSHTMPPEIFIGRKDELLKIEQPQGVNLIYGGRQLGKSALLKKARADIDGTQDRRAVLVDLKDCGCAAAARKLCWELMDLGILLEEEATEDWEVLCRRIRRRLRQEEQPIRYLLILLDEADAFIADCANCGYAPLVSLKGIQQSMERQFKFVLAGLHNVVRFNREVALGQNGVITHLPSLKVTPFRPAEAEELLAEPLSYLGFSLPGKVTVSQILATANYFPGLIQLYGQKLIESVREADYAGYDLRSTPPYVVTDKHLRRVMADREFTDQIREKFEITLRLDQDQGSFYYPLALLIGWMSDISPRSAGYRASDVLYHARDLRVQPLAQLSEEQIDALMQELQDLNILRSVERDTYLLSSKNFRDLLGSEEEIFEKLMELGGDGQ